MQFLRDLLGWFAGFGLELHPDNTIAPIDDSFDKAMTESVVGLFNSELHRKPAALAYNGGRWQGLDDLDIGTCAWGVVVQGGASPRRDSTTARPAEVVAEYRRRSQPAVG